MTGADGEGPVARIDLTPLLRAPIDVDEELVALIDDCAAAVGVLEGVIRSVAEQLEQLPRGESVSALQVQRMLTSISRAEHHSEQVARKRDCLANSIIAKLG